MLYVWDCNTCLFVHKVVLYDEEALMMMMMMMMMMYVCMFLIKSQEEISLQVQGVPVMLSSHQAVTTPHLNLD